MNRVFRVVKKPLCFGTGDPQPEWTFYVAAESIADVQWTLDRSGIDQTGIKIHEVGGKSMFNFARFLAEKRRR